MVDAWELSPAVTGAVTDHVNLWKGCYRSPQLLGGSSTYVLSCAGHIASLVNPPGNAKSTYYLGPPPGPDPQKWLEQSTKHTGSWWDVWAEWSAKRSGALIPVRKHLGSKRHPVLGPAPGDYVREPA